MSQSDTRNFGGKLYIHFADAVGGTGVKKMTFLRGTVGLCICGLDFWDWGCSGAKFRVAESDIG
ncbi:MAG: hypothetical protein JWO91_2682 [Acidobacteriaceae bacterium]|nr:hypothetical protein [Acidobacteriaceae bacterium]